ncbi:aminotransferase family protein [Desulforhopalus singaporensis]|uniref:Taurine--pyruvate aminotransferase n=1 Tax=Desulforhopalus singaporensis TaxID=91360 RepID=A0A1H0SG77_9BACT|nr:aminotransferase class III-fold pyridoxal phosphate-dependent enzyme [Desulforhopalus singaporensis]SDP40176.1 taurine-pyruvate aminotransferase [Desulforhopalus singaporensis]
MTINAKSIIEKDKAHVWHHLIQHKPFKENDPIVMVEGKGLRIQDINGKEYTDALSGGVWSVNVGYGEKRIVEAINEQNKKMCYWAGTGGTIPAIELAESIVSKMERMSRVYLCTSGSEANEKAFKMVRQRSALKFDGKKYKILYRDRDYHGTTISTLSAGGQEERRMQYGPYTPGFVQFEHCCCYRCPFGKEYGSCKIECAKALEQCILMEGPDSVGGVIIEPMTAGGGIIIPVKEYLPMVREICDKYDIWLIIDEVVCGLGRTGKWFGYQHTDIVPDIVTTAKGLASSYAPLAATITTEEVFEEFLSDPQEIERYFRDISTYGGCAGAAAAGVANLRVIEDDNLIENSRLMGEYLLEQLKSKLNSHKNVGEIRGLGLFAGVELVEDKETKVPVHENKLAAIAGNCMKNGVIIGRTNRSLPNLNNTITLCPALIATKEDIDKIVQAIVNGVSTILG